MSTTPTSPASSAASAAAVTKAAKPAKPAPAAAAGPPPAAGEEEEYEAEQPASSGRFLLFNAMPSWAVSAIVHFVLFIILALIPRPEPNRTTVTTISAVRPEVVEEIDEFKTEKIEMQLEDTAVVSNTSSEVFNQLTSDISQVTETPVVSTDVDAAPISVELSNFGEEVAPKNSLMKQIGSFSGSGLAGRGSAMRGQMAIQQGGTEASERAVARALEWFARHQLQDGGWSYDHRRGQCNGRCSEPGRLSDCRTGATAMALLPFLGAGQTHKDGKYKEVVHRGLYFLTSQIKQRNMGGLMTGDLAQGGGNMYSHGLSAIVLCEAYAMTQDGGLRGPAQLALNHITYAQDPVGGGWRYTPRQPGDTSVVGWQLMALKSGHMGYLQVDPRTIKGATHFLDSVQIEGGAKYGYVDPGGGQATTAVGLLCRMYLGWKKDHPALERGVEQLSNWGPLGPKSPGSANMYYNYYATQVMRHYEGELWDKWNKEMRDWLVDTQEANERQHSYGSWHMTGRDHGFDAGGRVYCTSLATMILEVYYRHMPLYAKQASEDEFPLK